MLETFYDEAELFKPNNEDKKKYIQKRKVVLDSAFKLHKILPEIFTDQNLNIIKRKSL